MLTPKNRFYRPELDSLRFVAFLGVFAIHSIPHDPKFYAKFFPNWLSNFIARIVQSGGFGVDLFFCLSSYLITSLIIIEKNIDGRVDIKAFYIRRILRIWPLYFFSVVVLLILWPLMSGERLSYPHIAGFTFLSGNWLTAFAYGHSRAVHLWSISIEEQFYIIWPLLIVSFGARRIWILAVSMLIIAEVSRGCAIYLDASPNMRWTNTFLRLDPIAVGAFLGFYIPPGYYLPSIVRIIFGIIGLALPTICLLLFDLNNWFDMLTYPIIAVGCGLILLAALQPKQDGILSNKWTVYLGKISFGLYVLHAVGLEISRNIEFPLAVPGSLAVPVVGLITTIALAAVSYVALESPFLRLKERFAKVKSRPV